MKSPCILVVDDSIIVRMILSRLLASDMGANVIMAAHGEAALEMVQTRTPDLIILDVEMPRLDGIATLKRLHSRFPRLPIVMLSAVTEPDAAATVEALASGAADFLPKHGHFGAGEVPLAYLRRELIPKITALLSPFPSPTLSTQTGPSPVNPEAPALSRPPASTAVHRRISILAIAVSTGGPAALERILAGLPSDLGFPIVVVQHIPPDFAKYLAQRLAANCSLKVAVAASDMAAEKGHVYLAPGGRHLEVITASGTCRLRLQDEAPENSCRPSGDVLFRSVARAFGADCAGLVLTGMGQDGLDGCRAIKGVDGLILAQDEASSVVWGMPGAVVKAGLADEVHALDALARRLAALGS